MKKAMKSILLIFTMILVYHLSIGQNDISTFHGTWVGKGHQLNDNSSWSIQITLAKDNYQIEYPSLNCKGKLTILKASPDNVTFKEEITSGKNNCLDGGTLVLKYFDANTIRYFWYEPNGKIGSIAELYKL